MSWSVTAILLSSFCPPTGVLAILSKPTNVHLTSHNLNLVLKWDQPAGEDRGLVYTTEYRTPVTAYTGGCVNISTLECDFTRVVHSSITENGKYTGRVRAQLGSQTSPWEESNQITLDRDTIIGSPNVSLFSNGATIEVSIKDPVTAISSFRNVYIFATYNITYWKDKHRERAQHISNVQQNRLVLSPLDPWAQYCVQVHINTERNPRPSEPSQIVCDSTTKEKTGHWVLAIFTFVLVVVVVAVLVVKRKSISHLLFPKESLPQHFKEYLLLPPSSNIYHDMQNSHPPEEIYHKVNIVTNDAPSEESCPLEVEMTT